jgi:hypothetical protein
MARTQMALLTQTSHSGLAVKTVNLLYLCSTGLQAVQVGYVRELLHIRTDPSTLNVLTARQGRQVPSISHLKIIDTRHNRHWLEQCKRIHCLWVSPKTKKQMKFRCLECNMCLCATLYFEVYLIKLHFWWWTDTKMEKQNTQLSVNILLVITVLIFLVAFSWWNNGSEKGCEFENRGFMNEQRLVGRACMCVIFLYFNN